MDRILERQRRQKPPLYAYEANDAFSSPAHTLTLIRKTLREMGNVQWLVLFILGVLLVVIVASHEISEHQLEKEDQELHHKRNGAEELKSLSGEEGEVEGDEVKRHFIVGRNGEEEGIEGPWEYAYQLEEDENGRPKRKFFAYNKRKFFDFGGPEKRKFFGYDKRKFFDFGDKRKFFDFGGQVDKRKFFGFNRK